MNEASSGRARGSTPGSLKLVLSNMAMTKRNRRAAKTGIAGERWTARYGHLEQNKKGDKDPLFGLLMSCKDFLSTDNIILWRPEVQVKTLRVLLGNDSKRATTVTTSARRLCFR